MHASKGKPLAPPRKSKTERKRVKKSAEKFERSWQAGHAATEFSRKRPGELLKNALDGLLELRFSDPPLRRESKDSSGLDEMVMVKYSEEVKGRVDSDRKPEGMIIPDPQLELMKYQKAFKLLRGIVFKRDQQFRTKLCIHSNWGSSAAGVVNQRYANTGLGSAAEWTTFITLFDEYFIHSQHLRVFPFNQTGAGPVTGAASPTVGEITVAGGANGVVYNTAMIVNAYQSDNTATTATAMANNPTRAYRRMDKNWSYTWRNGIRFDPHGIYLSITAVGQGWQGWTDVLDVAAYGGAILIRAVNDQIIGNGVASVSLGSTVQEWDISFRQRN